MTKAALVFTSANTTVGLRSIVAPNHVYCVSCLEDGLIIIDPGVSRIAWEVRRVNCDQISKGNYRDFENSALKGQTYLVSSIRDTFFSENVSYDSCDNKKNTSTSDTSIIDTCTSNNTRQLSFDLHIEQDATQDLRIEPTVTQEMRELRHEKLKTIFAKEYFFYKFLKTIKKISNPIAIYEVDILKDATIDYNRYGLPMYCHNVIIGFLGLEVGNVLTCLDFKLKLRLLSGKTNFITHQLWERDLTKEELKLGRLK